MNVYQLVLNLADNVGNQFSNVFHYRLSEVGSFRAWDWANQLIQDWITQYEGEFMAMISADCRLTSYSAKRVSGAGGPSAFFITGSGGTDINNMTALAQAADVQWQNVNPNNRAGHSYISGWPHAALSGGIWQGAWLTVAQTWINDMTNILTLGSGMGTATFCTYERKTKTGYGVVSGQVMPKPTGFNKRTLPNH